MIASKIAADTLLPFIIGSIGQSGLIGSMESENGISRNPARMGTFGRNSTVSLNPSETANPTRNITLDQRMAEINERRVARGEYPIDHLGNRLQPVQVVPEQPLPPITYTPMFGNNAPTAFQPIIEPLNTLPPAIQPVNNNDRSAFDDEEDQIDNLHQQLIDNVNNDTHNEDVDDLPLDSSDLNDSVEEQRAMNDQRPVRQQYPGGGNGAPSIGDIVKKGDDLVKVIATMIPKKKPEEKKTEDKKTEKVDPMAESVEEKKDKIKRNSKVDIHDIFKKSLVTKIPVNTKRLL